MILSQVSTSMDGENRSILPPGEWYAVSYFVDFEFHHGFLKESNLWHSHGLKLRRSIKETLEFSNFIYPVIPKYAIGGTKSNSWILFLVADIDKVYF